MFLLLRTWEVLFHEQVAVAANKVGSTNQVAAIKLAFTNQGAEIKLLILLLF